MKDFLNVAGKTTFMGNVTNEDEFLNYRYYQIIE